MSYVFHLTPGAHRNLCVVVRRPPSLMLSCLGKTKEANDIDFGIKQDRDVQQRQIKLLLLGKAYRNHKADCA